MKHRIPQVLLPIVASLALSLFALPAVAADSPNLLIIQTDEHNFRTLGCYRDTLPPLGCYRALMTDDQAFVWGKAVVTTPNIDWLANGGAICTSF